MKMADMIVRDYMEEEMFPSIRILGFIRRLGCILQHRWELRSIESWLRRFMGKSGGLWKALFRATDLFRMPCFHSGWIFKGV